MAKDNTLNVIETCYCRKCTKNLPIGNFYDSVDNGMVDSNGKLSICKDCIQDLYNQIFESTQSLEKTIHKLCVILNIRYSNESIDSLKTHMNTLLENGKNVNSIYGLYKSKLQSSVKSMDKSIKEDMTYEDVGTIYVDKKVDTKNVPISRETLLFWGYDPDSDYPREDVVFLEYEYGKYTETAETATNAQVVLLKELCNTQLDIKKARSLGDDTIKLSSKLTHLMESSKLSPKSITTTGAGDGKSGEALGVWIKDVEQYEPCQWLKVDPRGDMYRDVGNVAQYFMDYFVRPLRNLILGSKDFNINDEALDEDDAFVEEDNEFIPESNQEVNEENNG